MKPTLLAALLLSLVLVALPSGASAAGSCKRVPDVGPTGADPADAVNIRIKGTTCTVAKKVIRTGVGHSVNPKVKVYGGYKCTDRSDSKGYFHYDCRKGASKRITWKLGP